MHKCAPWIFRPYDSNLVPIWIIHQSLTQLLNLCETVYAIPWPTILLLWNKTLYTSVFTSYSNKFQVPTAKSNHKQGLQLEPHEKETFWSM
jgi:hypothetical protein